MFSHFAESSDNYIFSVAFIPLNLLSLFKIFFNTLLKSLFPFLIEKGDKSFIEYATSKIQKKSDKIDSI